VNATYESGMKTAYSPQNKEVKREGAAHCSPVPVGIVDV
jgi:hypothetical protein